MNEDELRERLRRIDPAPADLPMEPATSASSRARLEHIMTTSTTDRSIVPLGPPRRPRGRWLLAGVAAAALAAGALVVGFAGDGGEGAQHDVAAGPPLELSLGAADVMASCLPVEAEHLAAMPTAFAGTATAVADGEVALEVDQWYQGGDAEIVELHAAPGQAALIAGFDFEVGEAYLISASEGTVSFCGFSGPASAELRALFDEAFAG